MTQEQYEKIKHLEDDMKMAMESTELGSPWAPSRTLYDIRIIQRIYKELTGEDISMCSQCITSALNHIGIEYFNHKENSDNKLEHNDEVITYINKEKPKRGRRKKD